MKMLSEIEIKELTTLIKLTLKSMPEQTAMIYSFSRNSGLTYQEIAKELDVSQKTIEYHVRCCADNSQKCIAEVWLCARGGDH